MMRFKKYLVRSLEILLFMLAISLLVYFRGAIFQSHINQYIDDAQTYIEKQMNISIPVYTARVTLPAHQSDAELKVVESVDCGIAENPEVTTEVAGQDEVETLNEVGSIEQQQLDKQGAHALPEDDVVEPDQSAQAAGQLVTVELIEKLSDSIDLLNTRVDMALNKVSENCPANDPSINKQDVSISGAVDVADKLKSSEGDSSPGNGLADDKSAESVRELLKSARMAYWSGDIQSAEKLYLYLANIEDSNPDVYGELGNIYYAQGEWKQAGKAYYEAAIRLLAINKGDQVNYLLQLIQGLDSDSAQLLRQKISG